MLNQHLVFSKYFTTLLKNVNYIDNYYLTNIYKSPLTLVEHSKHGIVFSYIILDLTVRRDLIIPENITNTLLQL